MPPLRPPPSHLSHFGSCCVMGHFRLSLFGQAFDDVWSFRNCSFKALRRKKEKKRKIRRTNKNNKKQTRGAGEKNLDLQARYVPDAPPPQQIYNPPPPQQSVLPMQGFQPQPQIPPGAAVVYVSPDSRLQAWSC